MQQALVEGFGTQILAPKAEGTKIYPYQKPRSSHPKSCTDDLRPQPENQVPKSIKGSRKKLLERY
jgi:hypothetical protein